MPDTTTSSKPESDSKATSTASTTEQPLGEPGKKALEDERAARKQAENDLKALRGEFDTFKSSLSEAFGVKPDKGGDDTLATVQAELAQIRHEAAVYQLAAQHNITDSGDLELLKAATAEQASKLAERLAAKAEADSKPGTPKPDLSQGAKGTPSGGTTADLFASVVQEQLT